MITSERRACPVIVPDRCRPGTGFPSEPGPCLLPGGGARSSPPARSPALADLPFNGIGGRGAGRGQVVHRDRRVGRRRPAAGDGGAGDQALHPDREEEPARPVRHDQEPALEGHPRRPQPAEPRPRPAGAPRPETAAVAVGLPFPQAARAIRITRRVRPISGPGKWKTCTAYAVTSLNASQANPAELARWVRGHWSIEALHHIRDVTYGEDASQARAGNGPRAMATLRNLAIGTLETAGHPNIAAATRSHARDATRTIATLGLTPP
jgi:hypothetical protein